MNLSEAVCRLPLTLHFSSKAAAGSSSESPLSTTPRGPGTTAGDPETPAGSDRSFLLLLACFVLSGFAALLYETAWLRQFAVVFGTSEGAIAAVLASYMGGLALGASLAARFISRIKRPVLTYGILELAIGLSALAVPWGLALARRFQVVWLGGQPEPPAAGGWSQTVFYLAWAFTVILIPTTMMGATLPLLTRHAVRRSDQIGTRVGLLYTMNTAGAVCGVITAAFILLPRISLQGTVLVGVAANALVFLLAVFLVKDSSAEFIEEPEVSSPSADRSEPLELAAHAIMVLMLFSGMASFVYEVLWTRLLSHSLGGSIYAFGTMLATFLTGITLGSAIGSRLATNRSRAARCFILAQIGTALLSWMVYTLIDRLPAMSEVLNAEGYTRTAVNALMSALVLLPSTICIGATFPLAVKVLARNAEDAGRSSARVSAWNTIGAITGALLAGLFLLPEWEFEGTVTVAIAVNLVIAGAACLLYGRRRLLIGVGVVGVLLVIATPQRPDNVLLMSFFEDTVNEGEVSYSAVGRSATVLMLEQDGGFSLRSNGLPEAGIAHVGSPPGIGLVHRWLAGLPVLARPRTRRMMVIGFGGGVSLESIPRTIDEIDVVELEPEVIAANRAIGDWRVVDPLKDPRLRVILNDARSALALTTKKYDAIISQPSHPWTAGASHLYTREFVRMAKDHLEPHGVYLQWMDSTCLNEELLKMLGATLLEVYSDVRLYRIHRSTLFFLASDSSLDIEHQLARTGEPLRSCPDEFQWLGVNAVEDVAALLSLDHEGMKAFCEGTSPNTDNNNRLATGSALALQADGIAGVDQMLLPFDAMISPETPLRQDADLDLDVLYMIRRMAVSQMWERAILMAEAIDDPALRLTAEGLLRDKLGDDELAISKFQEALKLNPNDQTARFKLIEREFSKLAAGPSLTLDEELASGLTGSAATVVAAWRLIKAADYAKLAEMDEQLARIGPTDICFPHAVNLRAMWRSKMESTDGSRDFAAEAVTLINQSLATEPTMLATLIRLNVAAAANEPAMFIETAHLAAVYFENRLVAPEVAKSSVVDVLKMLDKVEGDPRVSPLRLKQIRKRFVAMKLQYE